jgi:hypothetical protein
MLDTYDYATSYTAARKKNRAIDVRSASWGAGGYTDRRREPQREPIHESRLTR